MKGRSAVVGGRSGGPKESHCCAARPTTFVPPHPRSNPSRGRFRFILAPGVRVSTSPAKVFVSFAVSGAVLLGAAVLVRWGGLATPVVAEYYSWASVIAGIGLAWRFRSSRALFAVTVLWMAERSLVLAGTIDPIASAAFHLVALLLPLNLVFFELIGESGLGMTALGSGFGILVIESAFVGVLSRMENAEFSAWA